MRASLAAVVVLPEPCRPISMMTVGGCERHGQAVPAAAEQLDQLVVDDLDDLLARRQRLEHVLPDRLLADAIDEGAARP